MTRFIQMNITNIEVHLRHYLDLTFATKFTFPNINCEGRTTLIIVTCLRLLLFIQDEIFHHTRILSYKMMFLNQEI